jgi:competence protein ComEC
VTLLALAAAWLAGTGAAALGLAYFWPLALLGGAGVAAGFAVKGRPPQALMAALCIALGLAGLLRYELARPSATPDGIALFNDRDAEVRLRGVVSDEPEQRERSQRFVLRVDVLDAGAGWQATRGSVLVTARPFPRLAYGDELELTTGLETPPRLEGFDYREYLARRGIVSLAVFPQTERLGAGGGSVLRRALIEARRPFDEALARSLPEPEAALARGILLGQRASIPPGVTQDFNRAGISHLVAISGWNVTLVAGFAVAAMTPLLGRRPAALAAMALVLLYALFVGGAPSVLRAAVMGEVMLGAVLVGRPGSALTAVCFTGAVLTAIDPLIMNDVAFQLSFAATLGIVLLQPPLLALVASPLARLKMPAVVEETLAVTTAASVAVLPIIAATFGRISLVALPANLLAVPAFPFVIGSSFLTAVAGVISPEAGQIVGEAAYLPLAYLVWLAENAGALPAASLSVRNFGVLEAALIYVVIGGAGIWLMRRRPRAAQAPVGLRGPRLRWTTALAGVLALAAVLVWAQALAPEDGRLTVTVLDVGQGDAILIETPSGQRLLVDGGPSGGRLLQALGRELPASARDFDLLVLTHGQDDHVTGLVTVLERFQVDGVLMSGVPGETAAFRAWRDGLARSRIPVQEAVAGEWADLGGGVRLEVLGPPPGGVHGGDDVLNDSSVVLRLVYGDVSFLLTGDIEAAGEQALLTGGGDLRSTVLKVAHHGSDGSSTPRFLSAVGPEVAVVSAGPENTYGHPSPTTLLRLAGVPLLRTDDNGSVRFQTDGRRLWLESERGDYRIVALQ